MRLKHDVNVTGKVICSKHCSAWSLLQQSSVQSKISKFHSGFVGLQGVYMCHLLGEIPWHDCQDDFCRHPLLQRQAQSKDILPEMYVASFFQSLPRIPSELDIIVVRKEGANQTHRDFHVRGGVVHQALHHEMCVIINTTA